MKALAAIASAAALLAFAVACRSEAASRPGVEPALAASRTVQALSDNGIEIYPQYPSLSPDGSTVVFSWAGDLWAARLDWHDGRPDVRGTLRLTAHPADERRSAFSPDGRTLAFDSTRDGAPNLYVMPLIWGETDGSDWLAAGAPRRVTFSDAAQSLGGFTSDGKSLLYSANQEPTLYRQTRMYTAPLDGGPISRLTDAYGFLPRMTGDGSAVLFCRGYASALDRPKYRGSGNLELYRLATGDGTCTRVTTNLANDTEAFQAPDKRIYFLSSRNGQYNVFRLDPDRTDDGAAPTQLTHFEVEPGQISIGHGVRDLAVSADGKRAVFLVWDTLYALDLTNAAGVPAPLTFPLTIDTAQLDTQRLNLEKNITEAVISPDGKTLAVAARGEIFVRSTEEGRPTRRVTDTPGRERDLAWSPDGKVLYFASDEPGTYTLYTATVSLTRDDVDAESTTDTAAARKEDKKADAGKRWAESILFDVKPLLPAEHLDRRSPVPSPDGKKLLFTEGLGDLVLMDLVTMERRTLLRGWDEPEAVWAGDSRHVVYAVSDLDYNSDIWLMDTEPGADGKAPSPVNITRHPDNDTSPRLSADGKVLVFLSERAGNNDEFDVWQVYLDKRLEGLKPYELDDYYKKSAEAAGKRKPLGAVEKPDDAKGVKKEGEEKKEGEGKKEEKAEPSPAPKPMTFDADDAYLRVRRVTSLNVSGLAITPAADRIIFSASVDGDRALISVDRKGEDRKTIQSGPVSGANVSLTGDKVTFIRQGAAFAAPSKGGKADAYPIDAPVVLDVPLQQRQKFLEAARILGTRFYNLKGLDWDALTARYLPLAMRTRTSDEFDRVMTMLFGELDGSHTGIHSPSEYQAPRPSIGMLGADVKPVAEGYRVDDVLPESPAARETSRLEPGDIILGIGGRRLADATPIPDLSQLLLGRAGKETLLEIRRGERTRHVLIVPTTAADLNTIGYNDTIRRRRQAVEELSGGRLGYLHIRAMGDASVRDFERDLYAAAHGKEGLIIDVRDNGGGYTTDILLASLTAPVHARTYPRGVDPADVPPDAYPRDRRLIYAYSRPINVLINENSFSNAEVFAHAIQNIKRGALVGTATFGGVISTGAATLLDGSTVRTPGRGWIMPDGKDMENHGAIPDVDVPVTPADEVAGKDPQLAAAVKELIDRIDRR